MLSRLGPACVWRLNIRMRNSTESGRKHPRAGGGWLRVQTVLVAAPDHKNSPHYRLEIKCEGRGRESWTGLIVLENIFLIRGILWSIVCWCCAATWY